MQIGNIALELVLHELGSGKLLQSKIYVFRLGFAAADHRQFHNRARIAT
jgi:hypothetical protein